MKRFIITFTTWAIVDFGYLWLSSFLFFGCTFFSEKPPAYMPHNTWWCWPYFLSLAVTGILLVFVSSVILYKSYRATKDAN